MLVGATILTQRINILGLYWIVLWNASLLVAVVLAISEELWGNTSAGRVIPPREESEGDQEPQSGEQQEAEASGRHHLVLPDRPYVDSICTYLVTVIPYPSPVGPLRA